MASPFIMTDSSGRITGSYNHEQPSKNRDSAAGMTLGSAIAAPASVADEPQFQPISVGTYNGVIDVSGDVDIYTIRLAEGQTYAFSLRGSGANPLNDTLLRLATNAGALLTVDDDGGNDLYSIQTYTATSDQTIWVVASSFANSGDPGLGGYTLDVTRQGADAVGDTNATARAITLGTTLGFRESGTGGTPIDPLLAGDVDRYAVTLTAGQYYTFKAAGGADYETDPAAVPTGELDTYLILRDQAGEILTVNDDNNFPSDISSGLGFYAQSSGTYYLDVTAYAGQTGGYALDFEQVDLSTLDPLDAIRWKDANDVPFVNVRGVPTAYVYFAPAGENFGETADDGVSPMVTFGWNDYEKQQVMNALGEFEKILGVNYEITNDVTKATFRLLTAESEQYGAYFYPQDPAFGAAQGIGVFNVLSGGWSLPGQASLQRGGFAYAVVLHEFGHAHGLAHPHDRGGGSDVMVGVTGASSLGVFDLNQGVYTVMSYNDAWQRHPDGPSPYGRATIGQGWSASLSAFDVAALHERYGAAERNTGNNVYRLADENRPGTFYETLWDTGGIDTISYDGDRDAQIDLVAATLDYTPTGGGVVSFVDDIFGGYTIANGVVIENAIGGDGNDVLLGNGVANLLYGDKGNDTLHGRGGDDRLIGGRGNDVVAGGDGFDRMTLGSGNDTVIAEVTATKLLTRLGSMSVDLVTDFDESGSDLIDLSRFDLTFRFEGTSANRDAGDLTFKRFGNLNAAERSLGIDLDGQTSGGRGNDRRISGWNERGDGDGFRGDDDDRDDDDGPVTVVFGNIDGGTADFALVLLDVSRVTARDFILTPDHFQV